MYYSYNSTWIGGTAHFPAEKTYLASPARNAASAEQLKHPRDPQLQLRRGDLEVRGKTGMMGIRKLDSARGVGWQDYVVRRYMRCRGREVLGAPRALDFLGPGRHREIGRRLRFPRPLISIDDYISL